MACPSAEQLVLYCMCWNTCRMWDAPTWVTPTCAEHKSTERIFTSNAYTCSVCRILYFHGKYTYTPHQCFDQPLHGNLTSASTQGVVRCVSPTSVCFHTACRSQCREWKCGGQVQDGESLTVHWKRGKYRGWDAARW